MKVERKWKQKRVEIRTVKLACALLEAAAVLSV